MKSLITKISLTTLIILLFSCNIYSQFRYGKKEEILKLQGSQLIVVLAPKKEEDSKRVAKLTKKKKIRELSAYRNKLKEHNSKVDPFNQLLTKMVNKYWSFNKDILFQKKSEITNVPTEKKPYFILELNEYDLVNKNHNMVSSSELFTSLSVRILDGTKNSNRQIAFVYIPNQPSEMDMIYGLRLIQQYLTSRVNETGKRRPMGKIPYAYLAVKNNHILAEKTLLIDRAILGKNLNTRNIKEYYPHKYIVVDKNFIKKAVLEENSKYVYVQLAPYAAQSNVGVIFVPSHHLINIEDGKLVGYSKMKHITNTAKISLMDNMKIIKGNLKQYVNP